MGELTGGVPADQPRCRAVSNAQLAALGPQFFTLEYGFRRQSRAPTIDSPVRAGVPDPVRSAAVQGRFRR